MHSLELSSPPARPTSTLAAPAPKVYVGIDNGLTGAVASMFPDGHWHFWPVAVEDSGKQRLLNIAAACDCLDHLAAQAGGKDNLVVGCELPPVNPRFGAKSNFTCGRCGEFWRVVLTMLGIPFAFVRAQTWQKDVFQGIPDGDSKVVAARFVEQRFPGALNGQRLNKVQRAGVVDAMCIAAWSRLQAR